MVKKLKWIDTGLLTFHQQGPKYHLEDDAILDHIRDAGIEAEVKLDREKHEWRIWARTTHKKIHEILKKNGFI